MTTRTTRSPRRRTVVALAVVLSILGVFVMRLVDIQVVNADDHRADSAGVGRVRSTPVGRSRGQSRGGAGARLLSRLTRKSWEALGLAEGQSVYAQVKAVALAPGRGDLD